ncbi:MAG: magnesium transporter [Candidatus Omnitrophica bacterium]|nr:magnesium transporter [Candidatus Omnitrophota bacterium]MCM8793627.1 magnesium transporter [Candidatus Omnitrophota bacterium]
MNNLNLLEKNGLKKKMMRNNRMDIFALFLPEIRELLINKDFSSLKELLKKIHSIDLAEGFRHLQDNEKIIIFKLLSIRKAVEVFEDLSSTTQQFLLNNLENQDVAQVLNEMAPDERARLFKELPPKVVKKLWSFLKKEEAEDVRRLLTYKEGTAGSIMNTEFVELKKEMTARRAIITLQESQRSGQTKAIYSVYVTDDEHRLIGGLSLQTLITAPPDILIKEIMSDVSLIRINLDMEIPEVGRWFKKYDLLDAPVVDKENRLLGIITIDDVMDIIEAQTSREFYEVGKMSGVGIRYSEANPLDLVKRRAGWLVLLLILDFLTGTVLKTFEHALGTVVALTFFVPMLLDTGGNAGTQTAVTIIRGLATGDVTWKNAWKIVRMELFASLLMGAIVGMVAFLRAFMLQHDFLLALVVGFTMAGIILLAISTGLFLPFLSKKIGLDPAAIVGPITTSIVDIIGLIIYFKIAQFFLPILRH